MGQRYRWRANINRLTQLWFKHPWFKSSCPYCQHCTKEVEKTLFNFLDCTQPRKHEALIQCWFDAGPASQTVGQYRISIGSTSCLLGVLTSVSHQNGIINSAQYIVSTVHRSHLITLITKAIDTTSISYQPLWLCCWRGDIFSFLFTKKLDPSGCFLLWSLSQNAVPHLRDSKHEMGWNHSCGVTLERKGFVLYSVEWKVQPFIRELWLEFVGNKVRMEANLPGEHELSQCWSNFGTTS